jgi:hypothetical protein
MLLSDDLLSAISPEVTSYIEFSDDNAKDFFETNFQVEWDNAVRKVIEEYYNLDKEEAEAFIEDNPNPVNVFNMEKGFRAEFEDPYIIDSWASRAWVDEANFAILHTLELVKERFPDIEFSGCIQYAWSDTHCGACEKFEINCDKIHEFIGNVIEMVAKDDFFWEELTETAEDIDKIKEELLLYKQYLSEDTLNIIESL